MTTQDYIYPKDFFEKNKPAIKKGLCFVIMPFNDNMNRIYDEIISKTLIDYGLTPVRADKIFDTKPIMISIMQKIHEAEFIIAEVTDRNPNVFYELGMAHILKEKVILITQNIDDIPFDLRHFRFILYTHAGEERVKLRESLMETFIAIGLSGNAQDTAPEDKDKKPEITVVPNNPELLSTNIHFYSTDKWEEIKRQFFAVVTNWVEFEEVEDKIAALNFTGGTLSNINGNLTLTLRTGAPPSEQLIQRFGLNYRAVQYNMNNKFDFGDLVRRSRGVRTIEALSKASVDFPITPKITLTITNTSQGSSVTLRSIGNFSYFKSEISIPYNTLFNSILSYLEKDPPTDELQKYLSEIHVNS